MTGIKALKAGDTESGASLKEPEVEKVSLILLIYWRKMKQTCPRGFCLSYEQAGQSQRCDATPSSMTAIVSWGHDYLQL